MKSIIGCVFQNCLNETYDDIVDGHTQPPIENKFMRKTAKVMSPEEYRRACSGITMDEEVDGLYLCKRQMNSPIKVYCYGSHMCPRMRRYFKLHYIRFLKGDDDYDEERRN